MQREALQLALHFCTFNMQRQAQQLALHVYATYMEWEAKAHIAAALLQQTVSRMACSSTHGS